MGANTGCGVATGGILYLSANNLIQGVASVLA